MLMDFTAGCLSLLRDLPFDSIAFRALNGRHILIWTTKLLRQPSIVDDRMSWQTASIYAVYDSEQRIIYVEHATLTSFRAIQWKFSWEIFNVFMGFSIASLSWLSQIHFIEIIMIFVIEVLVPFISHNNYNS